MKSGLELALFAVTLAMISVLAWKLLDLVFLVGRVQGCLDGAGP